MTPQLKFTEKDLRLLAGFGVSTEDAPPSPPAAPFDLQAAKAMIQVHREKEAELRREVATLKIRVDTEAGISTISMGMAREAGARARYWRRWAGILGGMAVFAAVAGPLICLVVWGLR